MHTPAPWKVCDSSPSTIVRAGRNPSIDDVVAFALRQFPDWEKNARLIAASPELLTALIDLAEKVESLIATHEIAVPAALIDRCRAAIVKALGE